MISLTAKIQGCLLGNSLSLSLCHLLGTIIPTRIPVFGYRRLTPQRLTPSSSSSELSKMLSRSCRDGARSVTCVRLPEPALPAAPSCRASAAPGTGNREQQSGKGEHTGQHSSTQPLCWAGALQAAQQPPRVSQETSKGRLPI